MTDLQILSLRCCNRNLLSREEIVTLCLVNTIRHLKFQDQNMAGLVRYDDTHGGRGALRPAECPSLSPKPLLR